jgi:MSHA biogenesis protein MshQ
LALACKCDTFDRSNIQPSTIVANTNWILSTNDNTGISPGIVNPGYLRLTNATNDNAKSASIPGSFPAAGNYLSVEFRHFAYSPVSSGADGMGIVFSDASQGLQIGGGGSSFAYSGFAGGWLGVGLDEWGGFATSSQAVGARGSATSNNPLGNSGNLLTSTGSNLKSPL